MTIGKNKKAYPVLFAALFLALFTLLLLPKEGVCYIQRRSVSGLKMRVAVTLDTPELSARWLNLTSDNVADPTNPSSTGSFGTVTVNGSNYGVNQCHNALEISVKGNNTGWGVSLYLQNFQSTNNEFIQKTTFDPRFATRDEYEFAVTGADKGLVKKSDGTSIVPVKWLATTTTLPANWPGANSAFKNPTTGEPLPINTELWNDESERGWKYLIDATSTPLPFGGGDSSYPTGTTTCLYDDYKTPDILKYATLMNASNSSDFPGGKAYIYFVGQFFSATPGAYGTDTLTVEFYAE